MISSLICTLKSQSDINIHEKVYINTSSHQWESDWLYGIFGDTMRFIRHTMTYTGYSRQDLRDHIHAIVHQVNTVKSALYDTVEPYLLSNLQRVELRSELQRFVQSLKNLQCTYHGDIGLSEFLSMVLHELENFISGLMVQRGATTTVVVS